MGRNILQSSVQNASFSIIFQILFRCITFLLNAFIIRTVGQEVLGIMNVRLLLLESTILFLSKEPILKACLADTKSHNWAQVINQIWLSVPFSATLSLVLVYVWINVLSPTDQVYFEQYKLGCYAIALSCIVEQVTQPVMLVAQSYCFVKLKVVFETLYIVCRTTIFVYFVVKYPGGAINAFSIAQLISAVILCLSYYVFFYWYIRKLRRGPNEDTMFRDMSDFRFDSIVDFMPFMMPNRDSMIDRKLCVLTVSFAKQSVIKQILTEGERYVMTLSPVLTFSEQSKYDIVNNLGSMAARFIFRPIEESAYFYFTQMIKRDEVLSKQDKKNVSESASVLSQLCCIVTSIGLLVVTFGQSYSYTLLFLYGGEKFVQDLLPVTLLRFHSFAVLLLAINGVTEGYVFATMTSRQLDKYNHLMVIFSITFLVISYLFTSLLGPVGFILANCINMLARITHSLVYIRKRYKDTPFRPLDGLIPGHRFVIALVTSGVVTKVSEVVLLDNSIYAHVGLGAGCFFLTLAIWASENRSLLRQGYDRYRRKMSLVNVKND